MCVCANCLGNRPVKCEKDPGLGNYQTRRFSHVRIQRYSQNLSGFDFAIQADNRQWACGLRRDLCGTRSDLFDIREDGVGFALAEKETAAPPWPLTRCPGPEVPVKL